MKAKLRIFLCVFLVFSVFFACAPVVVASGDVHYLAKITTLSAVYDEHLESVEFHFETTGTLYHEQRFSVTLSCSALEGGKWVEGKLISSTFYGFDGCVIKGNAVEGTVNLSKELFYSPLYKDFVFTVDGEKVDMGEMIDGDYYDLDCRSTPLVKKPEPTGAFFELGSDVSAKTVATGGTFSYKVYPKSITNNLSGGLSDFSFTLNYDPTVMKLERVEGYYPSGTGWSFEEYGFVSDGYKASLHGQGIKDDGDVAVVFYFKSLRSTENTELYALDVSGGDAYGHSYKAESYILLEASPVIKDTSTGDVNADGYVDSLDASIVLKYDAGIVSAVSNSGDVNADGYVDSLDASLILKYDAGILDSIG